MWTRLTKGLPVPQWGGSRVGPKLVNQTLTFTARLPSASDGLRFEAAFTLQADLALPDEARRSRALDSMKSTVLERAHGVGEAFPLGDHGLAEAALFRALNGPGNLGEDGVYATTVRVTLKVNDEDIALERRRERVGQQAQLAHAEHRARMERVQELITEVFRDPLTARMWWFEQNQDRWSDIRGAGEALDLLVDLCAHQNNASEHLWGGRSNEDRLQEEASGEAPTDPILAAFLTGVNAKEREALLVRLTDILDAYNRPDLVRRLHESWAGE